MKATTKAAVTVCGGIATMLWAMFADVSVSTDLGYRVTNLQLVSDRQNRLILGGVLAIIGAILFAVARMKESAQDEERNETERRRARKVTEAHVDAARDRVAAIGSATAVHARSAASVVNMAVQDRGGLTGLLGRVGVGSALGLCSASLGLAVATRAVSEPLLTVLFGSLALIAIPGAILLVLVTKSPLPTAKFLVAAVLLLVVSIGLWSM